MRRCRWLVKMGEHPSPATGRGAEAAIFGTVTLGASDLHSAIRADWNRIVTRETPTHEYATIATCRGAG